VEELETLLIRHRGEGVIGINALKLHMQARVAKESKVRRNKSEGCVMACKEGEEPE